MFRTLGLRHLCVVNKYNEVIGIVTRSDLASANKLGESQTDVGRRRTMKNEGKTDFLQHTINIDLHGSRSLSEY